MTYQASAWFGHTRHYLAGIDPHLEDLFVRAMTRAGFPAKPPPSKPSSRTSWQGMI
jgi:hypothetical protein